MSAYSMSPILSNLLGRLRNRLLVRLAFRVSDVSQGVHIGAGGRGEQYLQVLRVGGRVYVPPSSLKGALRSIAESLSPMIVGSQPSTLDEILVLAHFEPEGDVIRHVGWNISQKIGGQSVLDVLQRSLEEAAKLGFVPSDRIAEIADELKRAVPRDVEPLLAAMCPLCRLFGGPGIAAKLRILKVSVSAPTTLARAHIGVDRVKGTVMEELLFTQEIAHLDSLNTLLVVDGVEPGSIEARILAGLFTYLKELGIMLGGGKSRGLGWLALDLNSSQAWYVNFNEARTPEELAKLLASPMVYGTKLTLEQVINLLLGQKQP